MVIIIEHEDKIVEISPTLTSGFEFEPLGVQLCFVIELYRPYGPSRIV